MGLDSPLMSELAFKNVMRVGNPGPRSLMGVCEKHCGVNGFPSSWTEKSQGDSSVPLGFCEGDRRLGRLHSWRRDTFWKNPGTDLEGTPGTKVRPHEVIDLDVGQQRNLPKCVLLPETLLFPNMGSCKPENVTWWRPESCFLTMSCKSLTQKQNLTLQPSSNSPDDHAEVRRDFPGRRAQGRCVSRNSNTPGGHMSANQRGDQNPEGEGQ